MTVRIRADAVCEGFPPSFARPRSPGCSADLIEALLTGVRRADLFWRESISHPWLLRRGPNVFCRSRAATATRDGPARGLRSRRWRWLAHPMAGSCRSSPERGGASPPWTDPLSRSSATPATSTYARSSSTEPPCRWSPRSSYQENHWSSRPIVEDCRATVDSVSHSALAAGGTVWAQSAHSASAE
jgi:hypothetical protein